jgi:tRNA dimethylallyltransferase
MASEGPLRLHAELARVDPPTAARVDPADRQRIARALEVFAATGTPLSTFLAATPTTPRHAARLVALVPTSSGLQARIAARAERMIAAGLVEEVQALLAAGVPPDAPAFHTLGYREVVAASLAHPAGLGAIDRRALAEAVARGHRQYAKRQLVWLRGSGMRGLDITTLDPDAPDTRARIEALGGMATR